MNSLSYHGVLVVDKPGNLTSRDLVNRALGWFPRGTKMGHTGTLDPLATGVLVLCVGKATRLAEYVQRMDKVYRSRFLLGARSDTDDADGTIAPASVNTLPDRAAVLNELEAFVGEIKQTPPIYSAVKVTGRRAYDLARQGAETPLHLEARPVRIYEIELLSFDPPHLDLQVHCGKGTYIRSLARDLGNRLGCGALVQTLRRTRVGPFEVSDALSLADDPDSARSRLLPMSAAVGSLSRVSLEDAAISRLRLGQTVTIPASLQRDAGRLEETEAIAVFDGVNNLIGVATAHFEEGLLAPAKILSL